MCKGNSLPVRQLLVDKMTAKQLTKFLATHFSAVDECDPYPDELLREFLDLGALHHFIPQDLGGRFAGIQGLIDFVELTTYYSLPLGLSLGIAGSLFLRPVVLHAPAELRDPILHAFLTGPALGGLMLTEPTGGTDIGAFQTCYTEENGTLLLNGAKCWGGLTGRAEHWLVAARLHRRGKATKRMGLLYVPLKSRGVKVHTYFNALGLNPITYGETHFDNVLLPAANVVALPGESPLRVIYDTLFRSRLGLPAIATGLCRRLADEVAIRIENRRAFGFPLSHFDQIQFRLSELRGMCQLDHSLGRFTGARMTDHMDVSGDNTLVNCAKVICTETMHLASDCALQVFASAGYKRNHLVGRAYVDSRPFRVFEGVNEVLDDAVYSVIAGRNASCNRAALEAEIESYGLRLSGDVGDRALDLFSTYSGTSQRQRVVLGRIIAWLMALAILQREAKAKGVELHDGRMFATRKLAELTAVMPHLG
jgi:alkylation response protein AidB-like acyl-CoA dehydrogenase